MISLDDWYVQVNPIDGTIKVEMPQKDQLENPAKVFLNNNDNIKSYVRMVIVI